MEDRNRIIKLISVIVFLSFLLSTAVALVSLRSMGTRNQRELSRVLAAQIYDTISIELGEPTVVARTMANDQFLRDLMKREDAFSEEEFTRIMKDYLRGIREGLDYEAAFTVSSGSRRYYTYEGLSKIIDPDHVAYDRWYTNFVDSGKAYALDVDNDEFSQNAWTVFVNSRLEDIDRNLLGVCGVGFHMKKSQALFTDLENQYHVKICLIDRNRVIQVDTDESRIETKYEKDLNLSGIDQNSYVYQSLGRGDFTVSKYVESLDWFLVVENTENERFNSYLNIIVMNLILFAFVMVVMYISLRIIMSHTDRLTNASFRDESTGLYNRRAFEEDKARIAKNGLGGNLIYLIADVNGLKTANDTLGHTAGDELIRGAADCLRVCLDPYGKIYRIGGDEFAAILNMSEEKFQEVLKHLKESVDSWSGKEVSELAMSIGSASEKEFPSENITELIRIADERMYEAKEAYYRDTGKKRRNRQIVEADQNK